MLSILWLIIKIILWILLGILGLALLILIILLVAPIRYEAKAIKDNDLVVKAKVKFLFLSINAEYRKLDEKFEKFIRICGIKIKSKNKETNVSDDGATDDEKLSLSDNYVSDDALEKAILEEDAKLLNGSITNKDKGIEETAQTDTNENVIKKPDNITEMDGQEEFEEDFSRTNNVHDELEDMEDALSDKDIMDVFDEDDDLTSEKIIRINQFFIKLKSIWKKLSPEYIMEKLDEKSQEIRKKYKKLEIKIKRYIKFWNMSYTVKTRKYIIKYLKSLIRHILPRKIKGYVCFGFKEPSQTGKTLGILSVLPFIYQKHFSIYPNFNEKVFECNVCLKGRLQLGYVLRIVLKPYIWKTMKVFKKISDL